MGPRVSGDVVKHPLIVALATTILFCAPSVLDVSRAEADYDPGTVQGRALFRLRGGTLYPESAHTSGPGWSAGGAFGYGMTPGLTVLANYDYMSGKFSGSRQTVGLMGIQMELAPGRRNHAVPWIGFGGGVYVRSSLGGRSYDV